MFRLGIILCVNPVNLIFSVYDYIYIYVYVSKRALWRKSNDFYGLLRDNSGKHITVIESVNGKDSDVVVHLLRHF